MAAARDIERYSGPGRELASVGVMVRLRRACRGLAVALLAVVMLLMCPAVAKAAAPAERDHRAYDWWNTDDDDWQHIPLYFDGAQYWTQRPSWMMYPDVDIDEAGYTGMQSYEGWWLPHWYYSTTGDDESPYPAMRFRVSGEYRLIDGSATTMYYNMWVKNAQPYDTSYGGTAIWQGPPECSWGMGLGNEYFYDWGAVDGGTSVTSSIVANLDLRDADSEWEQYEATFQVAWPDWPGGGLGYNYRMIWLGALVPDGANTGDLEWRGLELEVSFGPYSDQAANYWLLDGAADPPTQQSVYVKVSDPDGGVFESPIGPYAYVDIDCLCLGREGYNLGGIANQIYSVNYSLNGSPKKNVVRQSRYRDAAGSWWAVFRIALDQSYLKQNNTLYIEGPCNDGVLRTREAWFFVPSPPQQIVPDPTDPEGGAGDIEEIFIGAWDVIRDTLLTVAVMAAQVFEFMPAPIPAILAIGMVFAVGMRVLNR